MHWYIFILENRVAKFVKVGKGERLGQIIGYWDEDDDKSQGDAVKS